ATTLEDSWRLRVSSAWVYSIVKNRDVEHFERVMGFLEATYRLLPRLIAPIKHMKIMFGLKTMVWK
uniref:TERF1-interacting nuclear factor 2 N-terminal domain-containing protein n=1 Tax=Mastacembelus armatus TaxID=205130 RepID=A0A3Q3M7T2_9TELE